MEGRATGEIIRRVNWVGKNRQRSWEAPEKKLKERRQAQEQVQTQEKI